MATVLKMKFANTFALIKTLQSFIQSSLKIVPKGSNMPAFVQIIVWRRKGHYVDQIWHIQLTYAQDTIRVTIQGVTMLRFHCFNKILPKLILVCFLYVLRWYEEG